MNMNHFISVWLPRDEGNGRRIGLVSDDAFVRDIPDGFTEFKIRGDDGCRCWMSAEHTATILCVSGVLELSFFLNDEAFLQDISAITAGRVTLH